MGRLPMEGGRRSRRFEASPVICPVPEMTDKRRKEVRTERQEMGSLLTPILYGKRKPLAILLDPPAEHSLIFFLINSSCFR